MSFRAAILAGTHSSVGKTTCALALMSFFRKRGQVVQPFKVGPDYIDPGFHHRLCHPRKSRNLDRFFLSEAYLKKCFWENSEGADLALVEGVMGLFDGKGPSSEEGSSAQMAKLLELPVILVVDGSGLARSAAALVKGFQNFDPQLQLCGVFLNRIGSEGHFQWLREAIEKETGVPVLGWLPNEPEISIPERHLGLRTALEEENLKERFDRLAGLLEGRLDEERFLALTVHSGCKGEVSPPSGSRDRIPTFNLRDQDKKCKIGIAYDRSFSFYYEDNFDLLRQAGAELVFFSPLADPELPPDLDALYLGGGFPELYARELSANERMKGSIQKFHAEGGIFYAECGGLIYLASSFVTRDGIEFPLVGLLPGKIRLTDRLQHFGYHELECLHSTFLFSKGKKLRSHEFHYSVWDQGAIDKPDTGPYRIGGRFDGFHEGRLLASYQHLHFGQDPELAQNFVQAAYERQRRRNRVLAGSKATKQSTNLEMASPQAGPP